MSNSRASFAEKRRILQLETLYDLAVALHAHQPEQELIDELLQRVCAVLDPAAAVAVTRDSFGAPRAVASVGWLESPPDAQVLLAAPLWREILASGQSLAQREGELAHRPYAEILATPLASRGVYLGFVAVLDKEERGGQPVGFTGEDRRFLESVASLAGVALDSARQVADLEAQRERLQEENKALRGHLADEVAGKRIVAHAPVMRKVLERVERVAPRSVSVVVRGESGTGKELIAKLLHFLSGREGALVEVLERNTHRLVGRFRDARGVAWVEPNVIKLSSTEFAYNLGEISSWIYFSSVGKSAPYEWVQQYQRKDQLIFRTIFLDSNFLEA